MGEPKLRFKADDGSDFPKWEEKMFWDVFANLTNNTLSRECLNAESGQARNIHYGDVLVKYGAVVDVQRDGAPFVNPDVECKRWDCLKDGDVVIADTAEDETVGKAVEISNAGSDIVYSGLHTIACRPKEEFAPGYLGNYINSMSYHDQLRPYMQGIKVTSVSKTNIGLTHLLVPALPEQRKIADCLSAVDAVIAAQQAEVDAWEKRKKGVMQKLFSQEVRFKADDGSEFPDWEEKTLGEVFTEIKEKNRSELPVLSVQQGAGTVLRDSSERRIAYNKNSLNNYKAMRQGEIIIHLRSFEGGLECSNHDGISSPAYHILRSNMILSDAFKDYFRSYAFIKGKLSDAVVGIRDGKNIDMPTFWEIQMSIPSLPEQRKIADCLASMDEVIQKSKGELAKWQELKKGLLQQMFV